MLGKWKNDFLLKSNKEVTNNLAPTGQKKKEEKKGGMLALLHTVQFVVQVDGLMLQIFKLYVQKLFDVFYNWLDGKKN